MSSYQDLKEKRQDAIESIADEVSLKKNPLASCFLEDNYRGLFDYFERSTRKSSIDDSTVTMALALLRRSRASVELIAAKRANIIRAADKATRALDDAGYSYGSFQSYLETTKHQSFLGGVTTCKYPPWLLNDCLNIPFSEYWADFWRHVALNDLRASYRSKAFDKFSVHSSRAELKKFAKLTSDRWNTIERNEQTVREKTQAFRERLKRLFTDLEKHGVFGVDAWGYGWAPGDQWVDIASEAYFNISDRRQNALTNKWQSDGMRLCRVDTKWEVLDENPKIDGRQYYHIATTDTLCYYCGLDDKDTKSVAETIVKCCRSSNLAADWDGDIRSAIGIELKSTS